MHGKLTAEGVSTDIVVTGGKLSTSANEVTLPPASMTPAMPALTTPATTTSEYRDEGLDQTHSVPTPPSLPLGKAGKSFEGGNYPPSSPTGIGERYSQTISNFEHAALLRPCELPL